MSIAQIKCHHCTNKALHNKFKKRGSSCGSALNECKESDNCAMWNKLRTNYNVAVPRDMVMRKLREPLIQGICLWIIFPFGSLYVPHRRQNSSLLSNSFPHLWQNIATHLVKYIKIHVATRWTIRHGLMLL